MRRISAPLLLPLIILYIAVASGDARSQNRPSLAPVYFEEAFRKPKALDPPFFVQGVAIGDLDRPVEPDEIAVRFSGGTAARLCVQIDSIDDKYWARIEYDIANRPSGTYQIRFPTKYANDLKRFKRYQVAISPLLRAQCDDGTTQSFGAVEWSMGGPATQVAVLVNSGGLRTVLEVPDRDGRQLRFECVDLPGGSPGPTLYDAVCNADIDPALDLRRAMLVRYRVDGKAEMRVPVAISLQ